MIVTKEQAVNRARELGFQWAFMTLHGTWVAFNEEPEDWEGPEPSTPEEQAQVRGLSSWFGWWPKDLEASCAPLGTGLRKDFTKERSKVFIEL